MVTVSLIRDRSGRSKGLGYVEFASLDSVPQALLLDGAKFCTRHRACLCSGLPLSIKPSEAEKNYAALAEASGGSVLSSNADRRVYLCGLSSDMGEGELRTLGGQIGPVDGAKVFPGGGGGGGGASASSSAGRQCFGYIVFRDAGTAATAATHLHRLPMASGGCIAAGRLNAMGHVETPTGEVVKLCEGQEGLSQQARATLMARLSEGISVVKSQLSTGLGGAAAAAAAAAAASAPAIPPAAAPLPPPELVTNCLCLSNCFNPAEETEEGWQEDILAGVSEEAGKLGRVLFSFLDPKHPQGLIFFMFSDARSAMAATAALSGRKFCGREISATPVPLQNFLELFPAAQQVLAAAL